MPDTNERLTTLEEARRIIEDNLVVMAHLEARQSQMLKEHALFIVQHEQTLKEIAEQQRQIVANGKITDQRIESLVSAVGALISRS